MKGDRQGNTEDVRARITRVLSGRMGRYSFLLGHPSSAVFLVTFCLFVLMIPLLVLQRSAAKEVVAAQAKLKDLSTLNAEYKSLKERVTSLEQKRSLRKASGIPQAIDEISSSLGLKGKVKGVKAIGNREVAGGGEESAEVQIEKVTMNELVNILYALDEAPVMLTVKRTALKKTFEDPGLFNTTLTLSLFQKK